MPPEMPDLTSAIERLIETLSVTRPPATEPLTYTLEQAADRLGSIFTVDWLKGHIDEIPKVKVGNGRGRGGRLGFTEAQLQAIVAQYVVEPTAPDRPAAVGPITRRRRSER